MCSRNLDHIGKVIKVAMLVGTVALAYFGFFAYSCALLGIWAYHEIDQLGYIPRKVSLFAETYLPMIANACLLVCGGTLFLQVVAGFGLITSFPLANQFLTQKIDALARFIFCRKGISLSEYEAPVSSKGDMTYEEIQRILRADDTQYEINPAHCSKLIGGSLKKDHNFDKLLSLFNAIPWEEKYPLLKGALQTDERFCDFLMSKFPAKDPHIHFEELVERLAREKKQTKEVYLAGWMKGEFTTTIQTLQGSIRPKGEQKDLAIGIENCAAILAYLEQSTIDQVKREDILLKLGVEAGGYCARAIKRASAEIVDDTVIPSTEEDASTNPQENYERKIKQALQNRRRSIVQEAYRSIANALRIPGAVAQDVHGFDIYRKYLSLGFYPLSPLEREQIDFAEILIWGMYNAAQQSMLQKYQQTLEGAFTEVGELNFVTYIRQYIENNKRLSADQKEALLDEYTSSFDWVTTQRFHRLMLVKLGILRPAAVAA